ncbi:cyclin-C [Podospora didyma]|uniref:RNA polymerase II holoenzyme cyclin-like subunit n=1 Tax=Podospora didyma TaxID=330526 RepID=A0AAE0NT85_9PEZI|nr:cyclin-C [Podospora didyma]
MAASFWDSTQRRHWLYTREELAAIRYKLEEEDPTSLTHTFPLPDLRHLNIYFNQQMQRLGKRLSVRQQALATAQVYIKRFWTRVEMRRTNPYLVMATAVYLACKMEECPHHIRIVAQEARLMWPGEVQAMDTSKLGECEFFLISEMQSQLIVHQPYRTLKALESDFSLSPDESMFAWNLINDHYQTDLPLLCPPHIIALTAVMLALVLRPAPGERPSSSSINTSSLAAAAATVQQAQARAAALSASSSSSTGLGSIPGTHGLTPQSSLLSESSSEGKKVPDAARLSKVQFFAAWLAESTIDIEAMVDCTQELISFYEAWDNYNEKFTKESISRYIKARGLV